MEEFGKGAFSLLVTEGLTQVEQAELENEIRKVPYVESVLGYASLTNGLIPISILPEDAPVLLEHMQTAEEYRRAYDYVARQAADAGVRV